MAVEEPAFRIVLEEGAFEIRDHPALVLAQVTATGDQNGNPSITSFYSHSELPVQLRVTIDQLRSECRFECECC